jgi:hypothetical protein
MYNMIFLHSVFVQVFIFVQKQASLEDQKLPELLILKSFISKSQRNKTKSVNLWKFMFISMQYYYILFNTCLKLQIIL